MAWETIFSDHVVESLATGLIGAGFGAAALAATRVFNRASGAVDIGRNTENILRKSRNYAESMGLSTEKIEQSPVNWNNGLAGILVVNTEEAAVTILDGKEKKRQSFSLDIDERLVKFEHAKRDLIDLEKVYEAAGSFEPPQKYSYEMAYCARQARKTWTKPTGWQALASIFASHSAYEERAARVDQAMMATAKILAASPEKNINLSGRCHIAAKWTNRAEWDLIGRISKGQQPLDGSGFSARDLITQCMKLHL